MPVVITRPSNPRELNTNAGRLHEFVSLDSVLETLNGLMQTEPPFVKALPKQPGQKEGRYMHLFGGNEVPDEDITVEETTPRPSLTELETRVTALEQELAALKEKLEGLL